MKGFSIGIAGMVIITLLALSAISTPKASAFWCFEISNPMTETGNFEKVKPGTGQECEGPNLGTKNFIQGVLQRGIPGMPGRECALSENFLVGYTNIDNCLAGPPTSNGNFFIRVKLPVNPGGNNPPRLRQLPTVKTFKGTSESPSLTAGKNEVTCKDGASVGEIASTDTIGKIVIKYTGCVSASEGATCTLKSPGASEGEVVTSTLKGQLGTVKSSEAASEVGLLLEPETGKKFATLAANGCALETTVTGSLAGEVLPISTKQSRVWVTFAANTAKRQGIGLITVLSGRKSPELEAYGSEATEESVAELEFGGPLEII
jgi:hypothetical protein